MGVQARMKCTSIDDQGSYKAVTLEAVYSDDKSSPNYSFSQATPSGSVKLSITNPAAFDQFEEGQEYDITFTKTAKDGGDEEAGG